MKSKPIKIILGIIGTIVIGAIGSGLWERILSRIFDSATSSLAALFSLISKSYANSLYSDVGKGSTAILGHFAIPPYLIIWIGMLSYPIFLSFFVYKRRKWFIKKAEQNPTTDVQNVPEKILY